MFDSEEHIDDNSNEDYFYDSSYEDYSDDSVNNPVNTSSLTTIETAALYFGSFFLVVGLIILIRVLYIKRSCGCCTNRRRLRSNQNQNEWFYMRSRDRHHSEYSHRCSTTPSALAFHSDNEQPSSIHDKISTFSSTHFGIASSVNGDAESSKFCVPMQSKPVCMPTTTPVKSMYAGDDADTWTEIDLNERDKDSPAIGFQNCNSIELPSEKMELQSFKTEPIYQEIYEECSSPQISTAPKNIHKNPETGSFGNVYDEVQQVSYSSSTMPLDRASSHQQAPSCTLTTKTHSTDWVVKNNNSSNVSLSKQLSEALAKRGIALQPSSLTLEQDIPQSQSQHDVHFSNKQIAVTNNPDNHSTYYDVVYDDKIDGERSSVDDFDEIYM